MCLSSFLFFFSLPFLDEDKSVSIGLANKYALENVLHLKIIWGYLSGVYSSTSEIQQLLGKKTIDFQQFDKNL